MIKNTLYYFTLIISIFLLTRCKSGNNEQDLDTTDKKNVKNEVLTHIKNPLSITISKPEKDNYIFGEKIQITVELKDTVSEDTVVLSVNDKNIAVLTKDSNTFIWNTENGHTGRNIIKAELDRNNQRFNKQLFITVFSDIIPEEYTYKIKKVYKHDVNAYTQGLFYHNGYLYEATGLKGESTVRKVKPETGEVIRSFAVPEDVFGEGITLFDNKIIQISWQAGRGFVYDLNTFNQIDEFTYSGEGWGICTDGEKLFMTDGSPEVKILEPGSYSVISSFEVYDNKKPVKYLNELEYIDGYIYANIYQYDKIVKFDPVTGRVAAYIDLSHILPMNDYTHDTDVLNGIAYDEQNKRLFVTGKKWPKLFEVEFVKK
ncbi:MAG: glutaminyl-peptide cyclotransferase [Chlorobi bacterium]|nr:glutaminyl-peptide cyclotransferase [Chlorobiota bacterium]